jgi:hypothetical protein
MKLCRARFIKGEEAVTLRREARGYELELIVSDAGLRRMKFPGRTFQFRFEGGVDDKRDLASTEVGDNIKGYERALD